MLEIQDQIAEKVDNGEYVAMVSLDLSAAFDVVNHKRLFKTLRTIGIPENLTLLIKEWFSNRRFYVEINGVCSCFKEITITHYQIYFTKS